MSKKNKFHCKSESQKKAIRISYAVQAQKEKEQEHIPDDSLVMRVAKITDKYMFGQGKKDHTYVVYNENGQTRAVPTTHLYLPDDKNMEKLHSGLLCKIKFEGYETPSGVSNYYFTETKNGEKIKLSDKGVTVNQIPTKKINAIKIKKFAVYEKKP